MKLRFYATIFIFLVLQGCATTLPPKVDVRENSKIGVMFLIDDKPKHVHVGTTVFNNYVKNDISEWEIKTSIKQYIESKLNRYSVVLIEPSQDLLNNRLEFIKSEWGSYHLNDDLKPEISRITKDSNIDFLITLEPYSFAVAPNSTVSASGYGLFTRCGFGICRAESLNNVKSRVYAMDPPRLVSWCVPKEYDFPIKINFEGGVKSLPRSEIDRARAPLIEYLHDCIGSALERADLTSE